METMGRLYWCVDNAWFYPCGGLIEDFTHAMRSINILSKRIFLELIMRDPRISTTVGYIGWFQKYSIYSFHLLILLSPSLEYSIQLQGPSVCHINVSNSMQIVLRPLCFYLVCVFVYIFFSRVVIWLCPKVHIPTWYIHNHFFNKISTFLIFYTNWLQVTFFLLHRTLSLKLKTDHVQHASSFWLSTIYTNFIL